jgi:transcription antitermination factor NusG
MTQLLSSTNLTAELDLFADEIAGDWHVLHTKSRQEKVVGSELNAMQIAHFLPLKKQVRFYGRRRAVVEEPLFPGYIFLRGSLDEVYRIDRTKRVANIIRVADQRKLRAELRNIHMALSHEVALDPFPFLKEGVHVVIKSGPMQGLRGLIQHRWATNRLILQVEMLGRAVALEIDGSLLEVID